MFKNLGPQPSAGGVRILNATAHSNVVRMLLLLELILSKQFK